MTWVKLSDAFPQHRKILQAEPLGLAVHVRALCWAGANLTDGWIPSIVAKSFLFDIPPEDGTIARLVRLRLWEEEPGGFRIHDFLDFNPSRAEVLALREKNLKRQNRHRHGVTRPVTPGVTTREITRDPGTGYGDSSSKGEVITEEVSLSRVRAKRASIEGFEEFWNGFPKTRRVAKPKAVAAWKGLSPENRALALEGVLRLGAAYATSTPDRIKFLPYPERWLKNHRWEDDPAEVIRQAAPEREGWTMRRGNGGSTAPSRPGALVGKSVHEESGPSKPRREVGPDAPEWVRRLQEKLDRGERLSTARPDAGISEDHAFTAWQNGNDWRPGIDPTGSAS